MRLLSKKSHHESKTTHVLPWQDTLRFEHLMHSTFRFRVDAAHAREYLGLTLLGDALAGNDFKASSATGGEEVSRPGELNPQPLAEPYVTVGDGASVKAYRCDLQSDHGTAVAWTAALISAGTSRGRIQPSCAERNVANTNRHTKASCDGYSLAS
jgi:hypothetical protein